VITTKAVDCGSYSYIGTSSFGLNNGAVFTVVSSGSALPTLINSGGIFTSMSNGTAFAGLVNSGNIFTGVSSGGAFAGLTIGGNFFGSGMGGGVAFPDLADNSSGNMLLGFSPTIAFPDAGRALMTNIIIDVCVNATLYPLWPLEESFQPSYAFLYSVPTATRLEELKSAKHLVDEIGDLEENWDGYHAAPISEQARLNAQNFLTAIAAAPFELPLPEISPKPTGTISYEWEAPDAEVYIEIGNTRYSGFIKTDEEQPSFLQGSADALDQEIVARIYSALAVPSPMSAPPVTEIRPQPQWWYERLAA
jgi:hypothetical protein